MCGIWERDFKSTLKRSITSNMLIVIFNGGSKSQITKRRHSHLVYDSVSHCTSQFFQDSQYWSVFTVLPYGKNFKRRIRFLSQKEEARTFLGNITVFCFFTLRDVLCFHCINCCLFLGVGSKNLSFFKIWERENRFTLGLNTKKNTYYTEECFKQKYCRLNFLRKTP